jgi:hypothetical protein
MRNRITAIAVTLALTGVAAPAFAQGGGNGTEGGKVLYNLNILGKTTCSPDDLKGSNRHSIQVLLYFDDGSNDGQLYSTLDKRNKIFLAEGDFEVLDGNACDSDGARFQLPANPFTCAAEDLACDDPTFQAYLVYTRALSPKGSATMTTCAVGAGDDDILGNADDEVICSNESVLLVRDMTVQGGKAPKFVNKTKELTTIRADVDGDGDVERVGIFADGLYDYFWDYDNNGLRHAQLRFMPIPD